MTARSVAAWAVIYSLFFLSAQAAADCIRSCTAQLEVDLTYQPPGQQNVQRKTPTLKTTLITWSRV